MKVMEINVASSPRNTTTRTGKGFGRWLKNLRNGLCGHMEVACCCATGCVGDVAPTVPATFVLQCLKLSSLASKQHMSEEISNRIDLYHAKRIADKLYTADIEASPSQKSACCLLRT